MDERLERVLERLEKVENRMSTFWNVPRSTGVFLNTLIRLAGFRSVLEIGTSNGYSGLWLAEGLSHTGGRLYTVESHAERFKLAQENFQEAGVSEFITQIKGHAPEIFSELNVGPFDLIFLDATKLEYKSYLETVVPMLAPGGLIIADNCLTHAEELAGFFEAAQKNEELESALLPLDNGLQILLKSGDEPN